MGTLVYGFIWFYEGAAIRRNLEGGSGAGEKRERASKDIVSGHSALA